MQYIVVDQDIQRRHVISSLLSNRGYTISLGILDEINDRWPDDAWIFAACDQDNLQNILHALTKGRRSYPITPYGQEPSSQLLASLINSGCVGFLEFPAEQPAVDRTISALSATAACMLTIQKRGLSAANAVYLLSARETEVAKAVSRGLRKTQIAKLLGISAQTVEIHCANAMRKMVARTVSDVSRCVIEAKNFERLGSDKANDLAA